MPKQHVVVRETRSFSMTLDREQLERLLLWYMEANQPDAAKRDRATVTFNTNDDGEVTGAMVDAEAPAV